MNEKNKEHRCVLAVVIHKYGAMCMSVHMYDGSVRRSMGQCQVQVHNRQKLLIWLV